MSVAEIGVPAWPCALSPRLNARSTSGSGSLRAVATEYARFISQSDENRRGSPLLLDCQEATRIWPGACNQYGQWRKK